MDLDNFKIGESAAPTAPTQNKTIPVVKNKFWAEWKVSPTHVPLNGGTGLGQGNVGTWGRHRCHCSILTQMKVRCL
ncbi:MAG: hypothetical protein IPJ39_16820 [Saprospiraceae bacterium]|nr:hypothetical protein [Saprospiraceae bacterium]